MTSPVNVTFQTLAPQSFDKSIWNATSDHAQWVNPYTGKSNQQTLGSLIPGIQSNKFASSAVDFLAGLAAPMPLASVGKIVGEARSNFGFAGALGKGVRVPVLNKTYKFNGLGLSRAEDVDRIYEQYPKVRRTFDTILRLNQKARRTRGALKSVGETTQESKVAQAGEETQLKDIVHNDGNLSHKRASSALDIMSMDDRLAPIAKQLAECKNVEEIKEVFRKSVTEQHRVITLMSGKMPEFHRFAYMRAKLRGAALSAETNRLRVLARTAEEDIPDEFKNAFVQNMKSEKTLEGIDRLRTKDLQVRVLRRVSRMFTREPTSYISATGKHSRSEIEIGPMGVMAVANTLRRSGEDERVIQGVADLLLSTNDQNVWHKCLSSVFANSVTDQVLREFDFKYAPEVVAMLRKPLEDRMGQLYHPGGVHGGEEGIYAADYNSVRSADDHTLTNDYGEERGGKSALDTHQLGKLSLPDPGTLRRMVRQMRKEMKDFLDIEEGPGSTLRRFEEEMNISVTPTKQQRRVLRERESNIRFYSQSIQMIASDAKAAVEEATKNPSSENVAAALAKFDGLGAAELPSAKNLKPDMQSVAEEDRLANKYQAEMVSGDHLKHLAVLQGEADAWDFLSQQFDKLLEDLGSTVTDIAGGKRTINHNLYNFFRNGGEQNIIDRMQQLRQGLTRDFGERFVDMGRTQSPTGEAIFKPSEITGLRDDLTPEKAFHLGEYRAHVKFLSRFDNIVKDMFSESTFDAYGDNLASVGGDLRLADRSALRNILTRQGEEDLLRATGISEITKGASQAAFRAEQSARMVWVRKFRKAFNRSTIEEQNRMLKWLGDKEIAAGRKLGLETRYATTPQMMSDALDQIVNNTLFKPLALATFGWAERVSLSELFLNASRVGVSNITRSWLEAHSAKRAWKMVNKDEMGHMHAFVSGLLLGFHNSGFRTADRELLWQDACDLAWAHEGHIAAPGVSAVHSSFGQTENQVYENLALKDVDPSSPSMTANDSTSPDTWASVDIGNKRHLDALALHVQGWGKGTIGPFVAKTIRKHLNSISEDLSTEAVLSKLDALVVPEVKAFIDALPEEVLARFDRNLLGAASRKLGASPHESWADAITRAIWHASSGVFTGATMSTSKLGILRRMVLTADQSLMTVSQRRDLTKALGVDFEEYENLKQYSSERARVARQKRRSGGVYTKDVNSQQQEFYFPHTFFLDAIANNAYLDKGIITNHMTSQFGGKETVWKKFMPRGIPAKNSAFAMTRFTMPQRLAEEGHRRLFGPLVNHLARDPIFLHEYHNEMNLLRSSGRLARDPAIAYRNYLENNPSHQVEVINSSGTNEAKEQIRKLKFEVKQQIGRLEYEASSTSYTRSQMFASMRKMNDALEHALDGTPGGMLLISRDLSGNLTGIGHMRIYGKNETFRYRKSAPEAFSKNTPVVHVQSMGSFGTIRGSSEEMMKAAARAALAHKADLSFHIGDDARDFYKMMNAEGGAQHRALADTDINNVLHETLRKHITKEGFGHRPDDQPGIISHDHASMIAQTRAMYHMLRFVHNPQEKTAYDNFFHVVAPFFFAQNQAMKRALRTLGENPGALPYYIQTMTNFNTMMQSTAGSNGFAQFVLPGAQIAGFGVGHAMAAFGMPFMGMPMTMNAMPSALATVDPMAEVVDPNGGVNPLNLLLPKLGPVAALADHVVRGIVNVFDPTFPLNPISEHIDQVEGKFMPHTPLWMQLMPSRLAQGLLQSVVAFSGALQGKDQTDILNGQFAHVDIMAMKMLQSNKMQDYFNKNMHDPAFCAGVNKYASSDTGKGDRLRLGNMSEPKYLERMAWEDAANKTAVYLTHHREEFNRAHGVAAASLFLLKTLMSFGTPTSETLSQYGIDWNKEYLKYEKKFAAEKLIDPFAPAKHFFQDHPGQAVYVTRSTTSDAIRYNVASANWSPLEPVFGFFREHQNLIVNKGYGAPVQYLIPAAMKDRNNPNNAYSQHFGQVLNAYGQRDKMTPEEFGNQMLINLGDVARDLYLQPQLDYMHANPQMFSGSQIWSFEKNWIKNYGDRVNYAYAKAFSQNEVVNNSSMVIQQSQEMMAKEPEFKSAVEFAKSVPVGNSTQQAVENFVTVTQHGAPGSFENMSVAMAWMNNLYNEFQNGLRTNPNSESAYRKDWKNLINYFVLATATRTLSDKAKTPDPASSPYFYLLIMYKQAR